MRIRKSVEEDWRRIKEIEDLATEMYYRSGFAKEEVLPRTEEDLRFLLANTQMMVAVDDEAEHLLGYISYYPIGEYLHLEEHAVHENYWRQGVGRTLLEHFFQAGEDLIGCQHYSVFVFPEAHWAWNCYQKAGFQVQDLEQISHLDQEILARMVHHELKVKESSGVGRVLMIKPR